MTKQESVIISQIQVLICGGFLLLNSGVLIGISALVSSLSWNLGLLHSTILFSSRLTSLKKEVYSW